MSGACGHDVLIPPGEMVHGLRLAPTSLVVDPVPGVRRAREGGRVGQVG